jgi:hypothetical protein
MVQFAGSVQIAMWNPLGKDASQHNWLFGQSAVALQVRPAKVHVEVALATQVMSWSAEEL